MITLSMASQESKIPLRILRWYVTTGKMWAERKIDEFGLPYYVTVRMEVERVKRMYRPHAR